MLVCQTSSTQMPGRSRRCLSSSADAGRAVLPSPAAAALSSFPDIRQVQERGVRGLFCDYRELLKQIQHSYNPTVNSTELDVLKPVFEAEILRDGPEPVGGPEGVLGHRAAG